MPALARREILDLIINRNLIVGYKDLDSQLTPNGIDVRCCAIIEIKKGGEIGLIKQENIPPKFGKAYVLEGYKEVISSLNVEEIIELKEGEKVSLKKLNPYLVITCEMLNTLKNIFFKIEIKSTLFRYGQIMLETAFGEAGYKGRLTFLMVPFSDTKLAIGAGIAQISFYTLTSCATYDAQKNKNYQGGKII